ncbi:DUF1285 domain-containing protein [Fulvimarina sp. 2208YS6-2-32]|uniref:DUF1285 domain-containing protein n=1 Tax=Fulvimarina uroteuthidis TaxID=3098149 RepID=A0ABU5I5R0_9HYPH|nr:DUF1285 domain-containing protein [Fulvimarina sp. 2208YS6-2-32]MDY8110078.1 DUF1285 domain-containing protein [Fulvimarina sp. 2208YS6-2-32]
MMKQNDPHHAELNALAARAEASGADGAPVERWNPPHCGEIDMRIAADGRWFYNGTTIDRPALVRLFASVLKIEEDGETYLVTPAEKLRITVEDAHFIAVEVARSYEDGVQVLTFRTNIGDVVRAGPDRPVRLSEDVEAGFCPYLVVRRGLTAKVTRAVALELAAMLEDDDAGTFLTSDGARFYGPKAERA